LIVFVQLVRNKTILWFLTNTNSSEIFENNGTIKPDTNYIFTFARGRHLCDHTHT